MMMKRVKVEEVTSSSLSSSSLSSSTENLYRGVKIEEKKEEDVKEEEEEEHDPPQRRLVVDPSSDNTTTTEEEATGDDVKEENPSSNGGACTAYNGNEGDDCWMPGNWCWLSSPAPGNDNNDNTMDDEKPKARTPPPPTSTSARGTCRRNTNMTKKDTTSSMQGKKKKKKEEANMKVMEGTENETVAAAAAAKMSKNTTEEAVRLIPNEVVSSNDGGTCGRSDRYTASCNKAIHNDSNSTDSMNWKAGNWCWLETTPPARDSNTNRTIASRQNLSQQSDNKTGCEIIDDNADNNDGKKKKTEQNALFAITTAPTELTVNDAVVTAVTATTATQLLLHDGNELDDGGDNNGAVNSRKVANKASTTTRRNRSFGKWTKQEIAILRKGMKLYGKSWNHNSWPKYISRQIAKLIPSRSGTSVHSKCKEIFDEAPPSPSPPPVAAVAANIEDVTANVMITDDSSATNRSKRVNDNDILFSNRNRNHPGNTRLGKLITDTIAEFKVTLETNQNTKRLCYQYLYNRLKNDDSSVRILEWNTNNNQWIEAAKDKILSSLRTRIVRKLKNTRKNEGCGKQLQSAPDKMTVDDNTTEYVLNVDDESSIRALLATIDIKNLPSFVKPILRDPRIIIPGHKKKYRYRGVNLPNLKIKWKARISFKGVDYNLGDYNSQRDAGSIYAWVHLILYGEEATRKAESEGEDAVAAFEQEKFGINASHTSNNIQNIHSASITVNDNDILLFDGSQNKGKYYENSRLRNLVDHAIKENGSQKNKEISLSLYTKLKYSDLPHRFLRRSIINGDWFEVSEEIAVRTIYAMVIKKKRATVDAFKSVDTTTRTTATRYMSEIRPVDSLTASLGSARECRYCMEHRESNTRCANCLVKALEEGDTKICSNCDLLRRTARCENYLSSTCRCVVDCKEHYVCGNGHINWLQAQKRKRKRDEEVNDGETLFGDMLPVSKKLK